MIKRLILTFCASSMVLFAQQPEAQPAPATPPAAKPEAPAPAKPEAPKPGEEAPAEDPLKKLKLPGISIHPEGGYIDVESEICLASGALELVACTKDTKEHEAIIKVMAQAVHIHMALLLIGAQAGSPMMNQPVGEGEERRWIYRPASGQPIDVSLVITGEDGKQQVRPIADFIQRIQEPDEGAFLEGQQQAPDKDKDAKKAEEEKFPGNHFIFTGSVLVENGEGPRRYIADETGDVITISAFGCEVIGLSDRYSSENGNLVWEVNSDVTPKVGTKVLLRLAPVKKP
ncbi:MAG TPA: YdjY domain-containing protein [Luteolibacter sp.]|nr:YdjY domain-containing protein [Luteolibacter sp.]